MTDNDNPLRFSIENGRLYNDSGKKGFREVTHIQRLDGGGIDYLKLAPRRSKWNCHGLGISDFGRL